MNRIKNILFTLCALVLLPLRRVQGPSLRRIVIVQNAKLGDMVCTTPLFRAIKKKYPEAHLTVMGSSLNGEMLAGHPYVDQYLVSPRGFFATVHMLVRGSFDFATMVGPDPQLLAAFICARIPQVVVPHIADVHSPYETSSYRFLSTFVTKAQYHVSRYVPREYMLLLEPIGIFNDDARKELAVSKDAVIRVKELLAQKGYEPEKDFIVGIAPSAGAIKIKAWGAERFAQVAQYLSTSRKAIIVIIAGKGEKEDVDSMLHALSKDARVLNLCGVLSIEELKALITLLKLFISSDTGPVHIAEAFQIPTVNVLGAVDEYETFLSGPRTRAVFAAERGRPELHVLTSASYDAREVRRQTDMITVPMVTAAVENLLKNVQGA